MIKFSLLLYALALVESGNDNFRVGDGGRAIGKYQIHNAVVDDVNRIYETNFTYADRLNENKQKQLVILYLSHYCRIYTERTGNDADYMIAAKIWNAGPSYVLEHKNRHSVECYATRVNNLIKERKNSGK
jgi:hypothetical protein